MIVGLMGGDCRVREGGCCYCHCSVVEGRWSLVGLRWSAGLTRLFSCESAKVANNFAEIS